MGKLQPNDQLLNCSLKHEINTMAVKWMASIVQQSLAAGEQVVASLLICQHFMQFLWHGLVNHFKSFLEDKT